MADKKPTYDELLSFVTKVSDDGVWGYGMEADAILNGTRADKAPGRLLVVVQRGKVVSIVADEDCRVVVADLDAHSDTRLPLVELLDQDEGELSEANPVAVIRSPDVLNRIEKANSGREIFVVPHEPQSNDDVPGSTM